jgi:hypothetical protein
VTDTAAGVIGFVCLMFFCSIDFPTVFHDIRKVPMYHLIH